jgi:Na+-transporting methylmalonyl-CoA/oxaloacetate decarboxylase gamma subunit
MTSPFISSLWITLIGMGLVFIAILALWGLMELSVRLTARFARGESEEEVEESQTDITVLAEEPVDISLEQKRKAAVAAVAVALAMNVAEPETAPVISRSSGSAWQAVLRGGQLNQRTNLYTRKNRGN